MRILCVFYVTLCKPFSTIGQQAVLFKYHRTNYLTYDKLTNGGTGCQAKSAYTY